MFAAAAADNVVKHTATANAQPEGPNSRDFIFSCDTTLQSGGRQRHFKPSWNLGTGSYATRE
jgi:hypothetical protein